MKNRVKQQAFYTAEETMRSIMTEAATEIAEELESRDEFRPGTAEYRYSVRTLYKNDPNKRRKYSQGVKSDNYDYRNYVWITINDEIETQKQYMISLDFIDIDNDRDIEKNSGNPHIQFGRIQFWKDLYRNEGKQCCNGPNQVLSKNGKDIVLKFCGSKAFDPCQSIAAGTYDAKTLADSFIAFISEDAACEIPGTKPETTDRTKEERIDLYKEMMQGTGVDDKILQWLMEIDFFTAPASLKYHGSYEGGLFDHSYELTKKLLELTEKLSLNWENSRSPKIVGMFHDLCKTEYYENRGSKTSDELPEYPAHGESSVTLLSKFIDLTEEEVLCIRNHMGAFENNYKYRRQFATAISKYETVLWTHTADMYASQVLDV